MKPMIGVTPSINSNTGNHFVDDDHIHALIGAGANPVILPYHNNESAIKQVAELIDGLYLTGGNDIDPTLFGEEPHPGLGQIDPTRDRYEIALIKKMAAKDKPILGVCRGSQILNIALGGDMYQDIYSQIERPLLQHSQRAPVEHGSHFVDIKKNSLFTRIVGMERIKVNSRHHQANRSPGQNLVISGHSSDGVAEVIEGTKHAYILGVQWHPESMAASGDVVSQKIFSSFIAACNDLQ